MSTEKKPYSWRDHSWKVGDRVLVRPFMREAFEDEITDVNEESVKIHQSPFWFHRAECEPLVEQDKKEFKSIYQLRDRYRGERLEYFINDITASVVKALRQDNRSEPIEEKKARGFWIDSVSLDYFLSGDCSNIYNTKREPPLDRTDWIYVREAEYEGGK